MQAWKFHRIWLIRRLLILVINQWRPRLKPTRKWRVIQKPHHRSGNQRFVYLESSLLLGHFCTRPSNTEFGGEPHVGPAPQVSFWLTLAKDVVYERTTTRWRTWGNLKTATHCSNFPSRCRFPWKERTFLSMLVSSNSAEQECFTAAGTNVRLGERVSPYREGYVPTSF